MRFLHVLLLALMSTMSIHAFGQCNNVLTNGNASSGLTGWNFSSGTGTTWTVQNGTYGPAFVASYNWTTMKPNGGPLGEMATVLPTSTTSSLRSAYMQMYRGHTVNYADKYYYKIELRSATNQVHCQLQPRLAQPAPLQLPQLGIRWLEALPITVQVFDMYA